MKVIMKTLVLSGFVGCSAMLLFGVDAKAYIDPSVATYMIQAIAGVVIAGGAVIGIFVRRAKKKVGEKLGIDENKNKEIETDEIIIDRKGEKSI